MEKSILDKPGANYLHNQGDVIVIEPLFRQAARLQLPFISDEDIAQWVINKKIIIETITSINNKYESARFIKKFIELLFRLVIKRGKI